ncbi:uncharacterized protein LOC135471897 [Liolophura sinensis]|uniref:uncharacterized protein LOC135471897 n=1 Tax=Liolophura sinensis TaxID=3198878 RepID=UPI003158A544
MKVHHSLGLLLACFGVWAFPIDEVPDFPTGCEYEGAQYKIGDNFHKGCEEKCVCVEFNGFPVPKCSPMCEHTDTLCNMIPNVKADPEKGTNCCKIRDPACTDCVVESPVDSGNVVQIPAGERRTLETEWCQCNTDSSVKCGPLEELPVEEAAAEEVK